MRVTFLTAAALAAGLAACSGGVKAPTDTGVCYAMEPGKDGGEPTFNALARNQPQMEYCAARLEEMRQRFLRMGGSRNEVTGAYQGKFLFVDRTGVSTANSLTGTKYFFLARTGDGRLAAPGAIVRDSSGTPVAVAE